jgi:hypothetical protein
MSAKKKPDHACIWLEPGFHGEDRAWCQDNVWADEPDYEETPPTKYVRADLFADVLEALILLEREMVLSGNAGSTDYGWPTAIKKTRAAIARSAGELA